MEILAANGAGYVVADYLLACLMTLAGLLHIAALRSPDVKDSRYIASARLIRIVAYFLIASRLWYGLATAGDVMIPPWSLFGYILLSLADVFTASYRIYEYDFDRQELKNIKTTRQEQGKRILKDVEFANTLSNQEAELRQKIADRQLNSATTPMDLGVLRRAAQGIKDSRD